jgi:hypothetical protein
MMLRAVLLLTLLTALSTPVRAGDEAAYLHDLITRAHAAHLQDRPQWRALVHYRANLILPGVTGQADDPGFYLAPDGKTDPRAELDATLRAFFAPPVTETDTVQHPQCRFIARYHWLRGMLSFDPKRLPPQPCRRFEAWRDALNARALTLVFPSAYINNPSSMFGHTLLRVDAAGQDQQTRLLAYAINYAVGPGSDGGVAFTIKSLIGAYPGLFSISPYYVKVREYSSIENRDIWEYRLNFTQPEIDMLLMHAWELGPVRFDYYFFDENCAYYLLSLFEVARPSLRLTERFRGWVIPVDTVRLMVEQAGMVREVVYRPANNTLLRAELARMNEDERVRVRRLAAGEAPQTVIPEGNANEQARLLEAAYRLVRHEDEAGRMEHKAAARLSRELLLDRSRLPTDDGDPPPPAPAVRPDQGHKTRRISFEAGRRDHQSFQGLSFRPAYNDLLDPGGGYTEGAQINFMNLDLRHYQGSGRLTVEDLTLVDILSLSARDEFFRPVSWKINTGLARVRLADGRHAAVWRTNGGAGLAWGDWRRAVFYGLVEGTLDVGDELKHDHDLGIGPSLGLFAHPAPAWKLNLSARLQDFRLGDRHREREIALRQSFSFGRQHALRLEISDHRDRGMEWGAVELSWHRYF